MLSSDDFEDRLRRLQRISLELSASVTIDEVAASVIDIFDAPVAAPSRGLYLLDEASDTLRLVSQRGMPPAAAEQFTQFPVGADLPGSIAVRERRTVISKSRGTAISEFASLRDVPRSTSGFVAIPLLSDRTCVGVLAFGFDGDVGNHDIDFLEAVAAQVAQAIIRCRLLERERRRRAELEFLAKLTDTALEATDHADLMRRVCAAAVPTLGDYCALYFLPETSALPEIEFAHVDPDQTRYLEDLMSTFPFDPQRSVGPPAVLRSGRTEFIPKLTAQVIDDAIASINLSRADAMPILERLGITSAITVALRTKRRIVGAIQFVNTASGRHYDDADVALAEAVAGRLAEVLETAWDADHQRSVAVALQRALLPPTLPTIPGVDLAARYWPAGIDAVGGDFYDVFQIGDDEWALVIGDVCGTGPDAAATTSIARHTIRAAARHGADPITVIEWLNEAILHSNRHRYCTVCYATLRSDSGQWVLTTTAAGHPLPIISTTERSHAHGRPGTLTGMLEHVTVHPEQTVLEPGDVIVLYTDGITDLHPPHGITPDELVAVVHRNRRRDVDGIANAIHHSLLERVPDRRTRDDAAVLVIAIRRPT